MRENLFSPGQKVASEKYKENFDRIFKKKRRSRKKRKCPKKEKP